MAAKKNGFVDIGDGDSLKTTKKSYEQDEKLINGKIKDRKNGYMKSTQSNGSTPKMTQVEGGGLPKIDWSKYDTFPGSFEKCSLLTAVLTHVGLYVLMFLGFVNQLIFKPKAATEKNREGYAPLYDPFEQFFSRYVYRRVRHCFNRPICSAPGAEVVLKEWESTDHNWTFKFTGVERRCVNLGSYNYLGFAGGEGAEGGCARAVADAVRRYGMAQGSSRAELGTTPLHLELERAVADFLGVEDAIVFGMGFATNTLSIPGLIGPGTLVLSDENNHASLILGLRLSRATVRVFRHNDVRHAEELARAALAERRWANVLLVVEGVYSMEGSVAALEGLVALKQALGLHLYVDEAHSVGALGSTGRGALQRCRVLAAHVDVLMGTFTKSFGAAGGYIAGPRRLVQWLRAHGHAHGYAHSMSCGVAAQVLAAVRALDAAPGRARVRALAQNTAYFRRSFCLSASHTREQLDRCLLAVEQVADELGLRYSRRRPLAEPRPS